MKGKLKKHKGKIIAALVIVVIAITVVITINVTGSKKKILKKQSEKVPNSFQK